MRNADGPGAPAEALQQGKPLDDGLKKSLQAGETQIERAQVLVADLVKKTTDTPYAFIGLTLVDITELHVSPARAELKAVNTDAADKQKEHVEQAQFHVNRARQMLADLDKTYEQAKRDAIAARDKAKADQLAQQKATRQTDVAKRESDREQERQRAIEAAAERLRAAEAEYQAELARRSGK